MSESRLPSLGARGEGWVIGQGLLLVAVAGSGLTELGELPPRSAVGWATVTLGLAVMTGGLLIGGRALSATSAPT